MTPSPSAADRVRQAEIVAALSLATDLGTGHPIERSLRACLLGVHFGAELGLNTAMLRDLYYVAQLRWTGCTADAHRAELFGDEIALGPQIDAVELWNAAAMRAFLQRVVEQTAPQSARRRSWPTPWPRAWSVRRRRPWRTARWPRTWPRLGFGPSLYAALGQLFERWDGRGVPGSVQGEGLSPTVRIMHIAMDAELFHRLGGPEAALDMVRRRARGFYDPELAERFCRLAPRLFDLFGVPSTWDAALAAEPGEPVWLSSAALDEALAAVADFTDLRSPTTLGHSPGVAALAEAAARQLGLPADAVLAARRAGLVHDVGMTGLPRNLCEKPAPLTESERERLRLHPYYAERILTRPRALSGIGALAALHHERLDGSGYHRGAAAPQLPLAARVLAAADVYRALTEPRPHRRALAPEAAADLLVREARAGRLDVDAVRRRPRWRASPSAKWRCCACWPAAGLTAKSLRPSPSPNTRSITTSATSTPRSVSPRGPPPRCSRSSTTSSAPARSPRTNSVFMR